MKCPKCYAENINEATKCGICGKRLKYSPPKSIDTYVEGYKTGISNPYVIAEPPQTPQKTT